MTARRRQPEPIEIDEIPEPWVPPPPPVPRSSTICGIRIFMWILAILAVVVVLLTAFSNTETWKSGVDLIDYLKPPAFTSSEHVVNLQIHDSPLGAQMQELRDHLATVHQAMNDFSDALRDPVWDNLASKQAPYLANPEHRGDQAIRTQFEVVMGALRNMSAKRIDNLDLHRQRYCVEAFTATYMSRKSINRIRYMLSNDNRQKASRDEVCRLSREHYNLVWILHPKHALVYGAMYDLRIATTQLAEAVDAFLNRHSHCPPGLPAAPPRPHAECPFDLPSWTKSFPWKLVELAYMDEVAKQRQNCLLAQAEEWEQLNGKTCADELKTTFNKLVQSRPADNVRLAATNMIDALELNSGLISSSAQDAWTVLRRYFDHFKFMRLLHTQTHQRWQCSEWQELHQRELAADLEHDQRMIGLEDGAQPDFWGAHLLNRSNLELESQLRNPETVARVYEMLLHATFKNGC